jgi:hypothetical protein
MDSFMSPQPTRGIISGQITHQYGFQLTEQDMFQRIFRYNPMMKGRPQYQQLECIECLKLTNKMLEDERNLIIANRQKYQKSLPMQNQANYGKGGY